MFSFEVVVVGIVALVGLVAKFRVDRVRQREDVYLYYPALHIEWGEYAVALVLISLVITPVFYSIGEKLSVSEQLVYEEFYNGVETDAVEHSRACRAGSSGSSRSSGRSNCRYVYRCGSYTFQEAYQFPETYINANGDVAMRLETRWRTVRADIECPHLTHEFTYTIHDSLPGGDHQLEGVYGAEEPTAWDEAVVIPADIPLGPPEEWRESRRRLDANDPRPVTRMFEYDNFILAAQEDLLLPYVDDIDSYLDAGLLPDHTENILEDPLYGFHKSWANKLSFVGVTPDNEAAWQEALNGLNGALGMTLRGDVHMVAIDASLVSSKVQYVNALKAYWVGERFGRRAVAKNAIIVVIGVDGDKVAWAEATTGMPYGNDVMLEAISSRFEGAGIDFTPEAVIGNPRLEFVEDGEGEEEPVARLAEEPGVLEAVILRDFPFARASMECADEEDGESCLGFGHLVSKIEPSLTARIAMGVFVVIISGVLWYLAAVYEWFGWVAHPKQSHDQRRKSRRYTY